jgi:hypothetical protein
MPHDVVDGKRGDGDFGHACDELIAEAEHGLDNGRVVQQQREPSRDEGVKRHQCRGSSKLCDDTGDLFHADIRQDVLVEYDGKQLYIPSGRRELTYHLKESSEVVVRGPA